MTLPSKIGMLMNRTYRLKFTLSKFKNFRAHYSTSSGNEIGSESKRDQEIFSKITETYEKLGTFASFGQHHFWKDALANAAVPREQGMRFLDAAGGQGAIAVRVLNRIKNTHVEKDFHVTVCDVNTAMMDYGKQLFAQQKHDPNLIDWVEGSVENLPFQNETFNVYMIALALRFVDVDKTIAEAYRVLKPGGKFFCMDSSSIDNFFIASVHKALYKVMPYIGHKLFNTYEPFSCYVDTSPNVPTKEKFKEMLEDAGFSQVTYKTMSLGWCAIHSGYKL